MLRPQFPRGLRRTQEDLVHDSDGSAHTGSGKAVQSAYHHAPGGQQRQRKLLEAKVLIVGAGGLGSPVALYLGLAGVGTLGIVDFDVVEVSNLQRQILHHENDVGTPKVLSAQQTLQEYNSGVKVVGHEAPLTSENAMEIISQYDVVVNGADNFPARYLVNDASYLSGKPLVDGSILLFDGQASVFVPGNGCYLPLSHAARRRAQCPAVRKPACLEHCRAWSAASRPPRQSSSYWARARRWSAGCCSLTR